MTIATLTALLLGIQACISDLLARRVCNHVLLAVLGVALATQLLSSGSQPSLSQCLLGGIAGLAVLLPFYAFGWMGAGDVKLFSTIGFLLGAKALLPIWVIASLAAGAHALLVIAWPSVARSTPLALHRAASAWQHSTLVNDWRMDLRSARQGRKGIPYAAYLGLAMIGYVLHGAGYA